MTNIIHGHSVGGHVWLDIHELASHNTISACLAKYGTQTEATLVYR